MNPNDRYNPYVNYQDCRRDRLYRFQLYVYEDAVYYKLYSPNAKNRLNEFMDERFFGRDADSDPRNFMHVFQRLGDFFSDQLIDGRIEEEQYAAKQLWLEKRKDYIRLMCTYYWSLAVHQYRPGGVCFEEMYRTYLDCEDRFGGIVLTKDGSTTRVLSIMPKRNEKRPNPRWTYPKGKRNDHHIIGCRCGHLLAHYRYFDPNLWGYLNVDSPIVREDDLDCALREVREETGLGLDLRNFRQNHEITMAPHLCTIKFYIFLVPTDDFRAYVELYTRGGVIFDDKEVHKVGWKSVTQLFGRHAMRSVSRYVNLSAARLEEIIRTLGLPWNVQVRE